MNNADKKIAKLVAVSGGAAVLTVSIALGVLASNSPKEILDVPTPVLTPSSECNVKSTVELPEVEGLEYTMSVEDDLATVIATPDGSDSRAVIPERINSSWEYILTPQNICETPAPAVKEKYADCAAVWEDLERPLFKEDEGWRDSLDWDADGIACEDNPATVEDEAEVNWGSVRDRFNSNLGDIKDWVSSKLSQG